MRTDCGKIFMGWLAYQTEKLSDDWGIVSGSIAARLLRANCYSINDERSTGGQFRPARLLGWKHSAV
jgi:hypothetical protein